MTEYHKAKCCPGTDCYAHGLYAEEPCWGQVIVVDEEYTEDDYWWIHACEGHFNYYHGPYIPDPNPPPASPPGGDQT